MTKHIARTGLPSGTVRRTRSYTDYGTRPVELVPADPRGELIEADIRVPARLVHTKQHTNERHEFNALIDSNLKRWIDWRADGCRNVPLNNGVRWRLTSQPKVRGPYEPQTRNAADETPDWFIYRASAWFRPEDPVIQGFTDIEEIERRAARYGIDLWDSETKPERTKAVINDLRPAHNPLQFAEERRLRLGLKREDFLIGPLSEPLSK